MSAFHLLRVSSVDVGTRNTAIIHFHQPPFGRIHYLPGQYVTLRIELAGKQYFRSYSLCSAPRLDTRLSIGVKRVPGGKISNWLVDHVKVGMEMEVMEPRGRFYLDNSVKESRHIVLLGGGSGLTPLYAILRSTLYNEPNSKVTLLAANREEVDIMFREELIKLAARFPDRLRVHHWLSTLSGRITSDDLHLILSQLDPSLSEVQYFICGPHSLMDLYRGVLNHRNVRLSSIHEEKYVACAEEVLRRSLVNGKTRQVRVAWLSEVYEVAVPPGSTVLDAAMDRGIDLPHSCKQGTCASCLANLQQGSVVMAREDALLDFERAKGKILTCQAQPASDDVFIRF